MDGTGNPCTEIKLRVRRGDRTRTDEPPRESWRLLPRRMEQWQAGRYPQELRERAVRMVLEHRGEYPSEWAAIKSIAEKFGVHHETRADCGCGGQRSTPVSAPG